VKDKVPTSPPYALTRTKERVIIDMCYTRRHDFGLRITEQDKEAFLTSGMTEEEALALYNDMKQLYENCIEPYMEFKQ